jgi:predicted ATP-binding protein involved in virulence
MKIRNIKIENYRSAKDISIDLLDNLNVLIGINGSGKTTILEALSISLSWLVNRIQRQNSSGSLIADSDIRYDSKYSAIKITCEEQNRNFSWKLVKGAKGKIVDVKSELTEVSELALHFQKKLEKEEQLPVIAYYPVTRVVNKTMPEIKAKDNLFILDVYDNALGGQQNFQSFFEWFRLQDDILNEQAVSRTKWTQQNRSLIKRKINSIIKLIKDSFPKEEEFDKEEFDYLTKRIIKDEFIYDEPRFLFHEISRLIDSTNSKLKNKHERIFHDLEYMFHKMEMYSRDRRDDLIGSEGGRYKDIVNKIIKDFDLLLEETTPEDKTLKIIWEVFIFANILSLWWLGDVGRRELEKTFRESYQNIVDKKQEWEIISERLVDTLNLIIKKETQQKKNAYRSEGKELKIVTKAIEQFIPEYTSLRVKRVPRPHMLINKGKEEFNLNQLSDGEKNMITLVGDIARRLAIANPNSNDPLKGNGIILIDELDLHLHPSWQRRMIPQLTATFPNCQFIVSTHSPQVISHAKPESLFLLKNEKNDLTYSKATESYGKNSDRILEDLLGVDARPSNEKRRIQRVFKLIEDGKIEEAKSEIDALSEIIVGGDPELVKANVLIKRKEIIGK